MNTIQADLENLPTCEQIFWQTIHELDKPADTKQEQRLVKDARAGGEEARHDLLLYLLPRVARMARKVAIARPSHYATCDDLIGEASVAILSEMERALETANTIAYLIAIARTTISHRAARLHHMIDVPHGVEPFETSTSIDAPLSEDLTLADMIEDTTLDVVINPCTFNHTALHDAIRALTDRERELIVRRYGLYVNAPEPLTDVLSSLGYSPRQTKVVTRVLGKLRIALKEAYTEYWSANPARECMRHSASYATHKPLTAEQEERLKEAHARLIAQNRAVNVKNLAREAHIDDTPAGIYLKSVQAQNPQPTQEERLDQALKQMQANGESVSIRALAKRAHVSTIAADLYLHMHDHSCTHSDPAKERIEETYRQLTAQGKKTTVRQLAQGAHIHQSKAAAFLRKARESQFISA
jgi:DNA-directed RNA polymerase specialized sigma24 family protein